MKSVLKNGTMYRSISRKELFNLVKNWNCGGGNNPVIKRQEKIDSITYNREYQVSAAVYSLWHVMTSTFSGDFEIFSNYFKGYHVILADDQMKTMDNIILVKSKKETVIVPHNSAPDLIFYENLESWKKNEKKAWWDSHCLADKDMTKYI